MMYSGMLEAGGPAVEEWLLSPEFEARLFSYFPCTDITPALANKVRPPLASPRTKCPAIKSSSGTPSAPSVTQAGITYKQYVAVFL